MILDGKIGSVVVFPRERRSAGKTRKKGGKSRKFVDNIGRDALGDGEVVDDGRFWIARIEFVEVDIRKGAIGCAQVDSDDISYGDFIVRFSRG